MPDGEVNMTHENPPIEEIARILRESQVVAVVGCSPRPERPSHDVAGYLQAHGMFIRPVNPAVTNILGEACWPSLEAIPEPIDVVCVFRRPEEVIPVAQSAVAIGAKVLWLQDGVVNEEAARIGREGGLVVVMDRCMMRDHARLIAGAR